MILQVDGLAMDCVGTERVLCGILRCRLGDQSAPSCPRGRHVRQRVPAVIGALELGGGGESGASVANHGNSC